MTLSRRASVLLAALLACVLAMANPAPAEAAPRTWQAAVVLGVWPNYAGAGDVLVEAIPSGQTQPTASAVTDANGQVTLTLESGVPYSVRFTYLGTGLYTSAAQSTGIYQDQQTLRVPALHTVSGNVYLGSESRPAAAGEVEVSALIGGVSYSAPVTTDDTGAYTLRLDPRSDYVVRFDYVGDEPWSDGRTPGVVEAQSNSVDGVDAVLEPASRISGSVRDSAGEPVSGATVRAAAVAALPDGTWLSYTGTTDETGAFRIDSMGPGDYEVEIAAPGYVTVKWPGVYWYPAPEVLDLTVPAVRSGLDATVLRAATIEGSVVVDGMYAWEYTNGAVFAELQLYQADRATWTTVSSPAIATGGGYRFSGILPGEYRVRAGYSGPRGLDTHVSPTLSVGEGEVRTWNTRTLAPSVGLQPGVLVKGSGPDVYLVDGPNQLVRLPSFGIAQDLGIPASYTVVSDARLDDYEIDHRPLSNLVTCDGGQLAAGGRLYSVSWREFPFSPRAELDSRTCLRLAITGQRFSGYLSGGGQVWYPDEAGAKHVVLGGGGLPAHAVNDWFLGSIPTGAPRVVAGGLVKFDDSPTVYIANGYSRLAKLTSFGTMSDFGLPTSFVTRPASERAGYEIDEHPLRNAVDCQGWAFVGSGGGAWPLAAELAVGLPTSELAGFACQRLPKRSPAVTQALLVKGTDSPVVFHVVGGTRRPVASIEEAQRLASPAAPNFLTMRTEYLELLESVPETLMPGTLVKTAADPRIYLVDGDAGLVPVASFGSVSAWGLSTSYSTVSAASMEGRTRAAQPLASLVRCGDRLRLGSGGYAWPVADSVGAELPVTSLDAETCAAMREGAAKVAPAVIVKSPTAASVWLLADGTRRHVLSAASLANLQGWYGALHTLDASFIDAIPKGDPAFAPRSLVKASDASAIYVVDGFSNLIPLPSFELAKDLGAGPHGDPGSLAYETVTRAQLAGYSVAAQPLTNVASCAGRTWFAGSGRLEPVADGIVTGLTVTPLADEMCSDMSGATRTAPLFLQARGRAEVWRLDGGTRRHVLAWSSVTEITHTGAVLTTVHEAFVNSLPAGAAVHPTGSLVKATGDPRVFVVESASALRPLASFESAAAFGLPTAFRDVAPGDIAGIPIAGTQFDSLVRCGGITWLGSGGARWAIPSASVTGLPVAEIGDLLCARLPRSGSTLTDPPFVKSTTSPTIYALEAGTRRAVGSWSTLTAIAGSHPVVWATVRDGFLAGVPLGTPLP